MSRALVITTLVVVATLACSEPPDKERQQAEGALAAARAADAATYAPAELGAAEAALGKYDGAVSDRDYREALTLALEARDGAYRAAKQASEGKAAARSDAEHLLSELETLVGAAEARLSGTTGARLSTNAADRLRLATKSAPAALQEARTKIGQEDYAGASAALQPIVDAIRMDTGPPPGAHRGR